MGLKLENAIYTGDNLYWLRQFPDDFVDLIYIDPPWCTNRKYNQIFRGVKGGLFNEKNELFAYMDMWGKGRIEGRLSRYIDYMRPRVRELRRVLRKTGSFYFHCDWHASHYIRLMLDQIFGYENFQNEIVWFYKTGGLSKERFGRKHDDIYFYTKSKEYTFNLQKEKSYLSHKYGFKNIEIKQDEQGYYSEVYSRDVWDIPALRGNQPETLSYPTQKPEKLLEKIIKASSNEGDLVLDAFCGCGTTSMVAHRFKRKFIGIDRSPLGCVTTRNRLNKVNSFPDMINLKFDENMSWQQAQQWCVSYIGGEVSSKLSSDKGVDGLTMSGNPIQVKHHKSPINDSVVAEFISKGMYYAKKKKGYIFSTNGFTQSAYSRAKEAKEKEGLSIGLWTPKQVEEIANRSFYTNQALEDIFE